MTGVLLPSCPPWGQHIRQLTGQHKNREILKKYYILTTELNSRASAMAGLPCKCQFGLNFTVGAVTRSIGGWNNIHWFHEATTLMRILYQRDNLPGGAVSPNNRDYLPLTHWLSTSQFNLPHSPHQVNHHYTTWGDWPMRTLLNKSHPIQEQCATELLHPLTHEIGPHKLHSTWPITGGQTHEGISPLRNTWTWM